MGLILLLLFVLTAALERLEGRPFVATRAGALLGRLLGARGLPGARLLEVSWLPGIGFRPAAQTWGELVLIVKGQESERLLAHEACHVRQFRRYTSLGLWLLYGGQWLAGLVRHRDLFLAYWTMGLEVEARAAEGEPLGAELA